MTTNRSMLRVIVISLLALAFVAGASAGVVGDRLLGGGPRVRIRATVNDMSDLFDRLALTPEQRVRAESIAVRTAPRTRAIMQEAAERLRAVADSVAGELRSILTPEQRVRLDSLRREPRFMLKRKTVTPGGTTVDTLFDTTAVTATRPIPLAPP